MTRTLDSILRFLLVPIFLSTWFHASALICKNGVHVTLDANGQATIPAEHFVLDNNSCCSFGISYGVSKDIGATFQSNVILTCDDLGQISARVKFNDCLGVASYCETFIIVQGNSGVCENGCGGCCLPIVAFKPLILALHDNFTTAIHASWFDDGSFSNCASGTLSFSFSQNIADTVKTLDCNDLGQQVIQLWVTDAAGNKTYGETTVIVQVAFGNCAGTGPCLPAPISYNGMVVPLGPDGKACIHVKDFDAASYVSSCSGASSFRFSFSSNPNDTVLCFTCNELGQQPIRFYIHDNLGNINYAESFLFVEDVSDYCNTPPNLAPPNDDACNAYDVNYLLNDGCNELFFNIGALAGTDEVTPPLAACGVPNTWCDNAAVAEHTVWFKFEAPASEKITIVTEGINTQLALWDAASCGVLKAGFATLVAANDDDPSIPNGGSKLEAMCLEVGKTYFVQMDGFANSEGTFSLKFSSTGPACVNAVVEKRSENPDFTLQPNPASNFVEIILNQEETWQNGKILLSDISGMRLVTEKLVSKNQRINISHLPPGVYFIHLQTEKGWSGAQKLAIFH